MEIKERETKTEARSMEGKSVPHERPVQGKKDGKSVSNVIQLPEWWKYSPIMDAFYRYGAYYY